MDLYIMMNFRENYELSNGILKHSDHIQLY